MNNEIIQKKDAIIKILTKEEILSIYTAHAVRHFPENELKPVSSIERMSEECIYTGYGLYLSHKPEELLCYAFFTILPGTPVSLLDYFAVMEEYRSHGIGSLFLQYMKSSSQSFHGFLIESEDPDYATDSQESAIRCKRLAFYEKNGALPTGIKATVFGVPYRLLFFPLNIEQTSSAGKIPSIQELDSYFRNIYQHMVSRQHYKSQIHISLPS